ncbi:MAG TPA: nuclear transport factor 2 family protein [Amycolatopsis sp.]|nr:nuclear transport factor 2 family protein [Amycolatopsis sp.]
MSNDATSAKDLARRLVEAFGKPDDIVALLAEEATWWITPATPPEVMRSLSEGREEIRGNMNRVFGMLYDPATVEAEVHDNIGDERVGAVRITLRAKTAGGGDYKNEYTLWVHAENGLITKVFEFVDTGEALAQIQAAGVDLAPSK